MVALPRDDLIDVGFHRPRPFDRSDDLVVGDDRVERLHHRARPGGDLLLVGVGHAEHLGDHVEGQREGELGDHVAGAALGHRVEHRVDQLLDPRSQRLDRRGREGLAHESAQARVVGWVGVEHARGPLELGAGSGLEHRQPLLVEDLDLVVAHTHRRIAQDARHVVVAEQQPLVEQRQVDRVVLTHLREVRVRIFDVARLEGVEEAR